MANKKMTYRVFLESEEYGFSDFEADSFTEAMTKIEKLFFDARRYFKDDKIIRRVGIIVE